MAVNSVQDHFIVIACQRHACKDCATEGASILFVYITEVCSFILQIK